MVDACVFDEFAPGAFDMKRPATIAKDTLRRCGDWLISSFRMYHILKASRLRFQFLDPEAHT